MAIGKDLWKLVQTERWIDPEELVSAVERQVSSGDLDYRSRLLIRDSAEAVRMHWGPDRFHHRLSSLLVQKNIEQICAESFEKVVAKRVMKKDLSHCAQENWYILTGDKLEL